MTEPQEQSGSSILQTIGTFVAVVAAIGLLAEWRMNVHADTPHTKAATKVMLAVVKSEVAENKADYKLLNKKIDLLLIGMANDGKIKPEDIARVNGR